MILEHNLITKISEAFSEQSILGYGHTLASCEYYDNWHWFPEEGDLRAFSGIPDANPICDEWPEEVKSEISNEIELKKITYKEYDFFAVTYDYLDLFAEGIAYLNNNEFKFYLAAWMINVIKDKVDEVSLVNLYFFNYLESHYSGFLGDKRIVYNDKQSSAIAKFLYFLAEKKERFYLDAEQCLVLGWESYLD